MYKALAAARTLYLVFIIGFTVRAMPWTFGLPTSAGRAYDLCTSSLSQVTRAAWLAIAWIALETLLGWLLARSRKRLAPADAIHSGQPSLPSA